MYHQESPVAHPLTSSACAWAEAGTTASSFPSSQSWTSSSAGASPYG
jgi:hypothetical protein